MMKSPSWKIDKPGESSNEGRRSDKLLKALGDFEDSAFHTVDLGLAGDAEREAINRMNATIIEHFASKIRRLVDVEDLDLARTLMQRLKRLDPAYPLPAEWKAILND